MKHRDAGEEDEEVAARWMRQGNARVHCEVQLAIGLMSGRPQRPMLRTGVRRSRTR